MAHRILTIGHSTKDQNDLLATLRRHGATAVADVRSVPASRAAPQFNKSSFRGFLRENGIEYVFMGGELGARSEDPRNYSDGRVQYALLAETPAFLSGVRRIMKGSQTQSIAIMCAEANPLDCHRSILVAPRLVQRGARVDHILRDGSTESHADTMLRLRRMHDLIDEDLFSTAEDLEIAALARQEARIAYVDPELAAGSSR